MSYSKAAKHHMRQESQEYGLDFTLIASDEQPNSEGRFAVFRNRHFLVQAFNDGGFIRLSINRCAAKGFRKDGSPKWQDGISWDELQQIKNALGYQDQWAVECYPPDRAVVNVANMRHLWILPSPPAFGWNNE